MSNEKTDMSLSTTAESVLRALFTRGVLTTPELPSKEGAKELQELGLAETGVKERDYHGGELLTWLTPEGQRAAIERTVKDSSCKCCYGLTLGIEHNIGSMSHRIHTSGKAVDELAQEVASKIHDHSFFDDLSCVAGFSAPKPEDTLHQALVAVLPSMPSDKMKNRAESIAEAINAAYAKLKEPASVSSGHFAVFQGDVFVSPSASRDELCEQISEVVLETIKKQSSPGGLLFQK